LGPRAARGDGRHPSSRPASFIREMREEKTMKAAFAIALVAAVLTAAPSEAAAQCATPMYDMSGTYASTTMTLSVKPCSSLLIWRNEYGQHMAVYIPTTRLAEGSTVAVAADQRFTLDSAGAVGIKPAEPGYIQIITHSPRDEWRVYKLVKTSNTPL
jgi:hypothetical protein